MTAETREVYEEKLKDVRRSLDAAKKLIESEDDYVRLKAIDLFVRLSELELSLVQVLIEEPDDQGENPLVRRLRLDR